MEVERGRALELRSVESWDCQSVRHGLSSHKHNWDQSGELQSSEIMMLLRQLSYAIKNQLQAPKATYLGALMGGISCLSLVLYGIRVPNRSLT